MISIVVFRKSYAKKPITASSRSATRKMTLRLRNNCRNSSSPPGSEKLSRSISRTCGKSLTIPQRVDNWGAFYVVIVSVLLHEEIQKRSFGAKTAT
jgi:hypothetical protein